MNCLKKNIMVTRNSSLVAVYRIDFSEIRDSVVFLDGIKKCEI